MLLPRTVNLLARFSVAPLHRQELLQQQQRRQRHSFVRPVTSPRRSFATAATHAGGQQQQNGGNFHSLAHHFKRQQHLPYFLEYLMWVVFGSEALHLIWLKMEYKEYKEKSEHKIRLLEEIVARIENGQEFNDSLREEIRMVLLDDKRTSVEADNSNGEIDDDYLERCKDPTWNLAMYICRERVLIPFFKYHTVIAASESQSEESTTKATDKQDKASWSIPSEATTKSQEDKKKAFFL